MCFSVSSLLQVMWSCHWKLGRTTLMHGWKRGRDTGNSPKSYWDYQTDRLVALVYKIANVVDYILYIAINIMLGLFRIFCTLCIIKVVLRIVYMYTAHNMKGTKRKRKSVHACISHAVYGIITSLYIFLYIF